MKTYLILLLMFCSALVYAQKIEKGNLNGATYTIAIPENWKGKLVMYAHGYEFVGAPKQSENPRFAEGMKIFLDRGFAVAASDYSLQGFALPQGVDETEALETTLHQNVRKGRYHVHGGPLDGRWHYPGDNRKFRKKL